MSFLRRVRPWLFSLAVLVLLLMTWELAAASAERTAFLLGRPSQTIEILMSRATSGLLWTDAVATGIVALSGFIAGNLIGIALGLTLWRFAHLDKVLRPYLIALGAAPIFALAPVLVVWFGTGFLAKFILVLLSTVLVATFHAQSGASEIRPEYFRLFRSWRTSESKVFRFLVLPSAISWVLSGLRLNVGFALLGAFIAEFISAEHGLAHRILVDAGLYNVSAVWAGVFSFAALALSAHLTIAVLERKLFPWRDTGALQGTTFGSLR